MFRNVDVALVSIVFAQNPEVLRKTQWCFTIEFRTHVTLRFVNCVEVVEPLILNAALTVNSKFALCFSWEFEFHATRSNLALPCQLYP